MKFFRHFKIGRIADFPDKLVQKVLPLLDNHFLFVVLHLRRQGRNVEPNKALDQELSELVEITVPPLAVDLSEGVGPIDDVLHVLVHAAAHHHVAGDLQKHVALVHLVLTRSLGSSRLAGHPVLIPCASVVVLQLLILHGQALVHLLGQVWVVHHVVVLHLEVVVRLGVHVSRLVLRVLLIMVELKRLPVEVRSTLHILVGVVRASHLHFLVVIEIFVAFIDNFSV